jgi:hypothetical protein
MKYDKYIISFFPGSSGKFVKSLLDRIIRKSSDPIIISPYNDAHLNTTYTGMSMGNPNVSNIYDILKFDPVSYKDFVFSKIFHSHTYPDFDTINSKFDDVGIILIKPDNMDIRELIFNRSYKNEGKIASKYWIEACYDVISNGRHPYKFFYPILEYPKNCLILKYTDIFEKDGEKYRILEILKEFTGIAEVPNHLNEVCEQYISNRNSLINQHKLR